MKIISPLAVLAVLFSAPSFAKEPVDYTAKVNDKGKFCAKVETYSAGRGYSMKRQCRSISEWKAAGYTVTIPKKSVPETTETLTYFRFSEVTVTS